MTEMGTEQAICSVTERANSAEVPPLEGGVSLTVIRVAESGKLHVSLGLIEPLSL